MRTPQKGNVQKTSRETDAEFKGFGNVVRFPKHG